MGAAGDGSGDPPEASTTRSDKHRSGVDDEEAAWFVVVDSGVKVGMVFASLSYGESGSDSLPIIEKGLRNRRARRWPGRSGRADGRLRACGPTRPAGKCRPVNWFGLAERRQADRQRIRGANAAAGSQLA